MFSEIYCVVKGKVQRVGYRDSLERYAKDHDLFGWVKNMADGSVEVLMQGTPDELKDCMVVIHQGSPLAYVESVAVDWRTPVKQFNEFRVLV